MTPVKSHTWRIAAAMLPAVLAGAEKVPVPVPLAWPASGAGYQIEYVQSISSPSDVSIRRGFLSKLGDVLLGPTERPRAFLRPFAIAIDAQGRLLVADPGAPAVHWFDLSRHKHRVLQGPSGRHLQSPVGLDSSAAGDIYVADSVLGKIFVFSKDGGFLRFIGQTKGEGIFKRPTGLAVDRATGRIYLTDTLRHKVYVLDGQGRVEREWGKHGAGPGEFNFPVSVAIAGDRVFVLDAMNFRVQIFSGTGDYLSGFGSPVNEPGGFFRPKGLAVDAKNRLVYVVDAMFEVVQAFTWEGKLVFAFGRGGLKPGEFRLPSGICVQADGGILVADSFNRRIQAFRPRPVPATAGGGGQ